MRISYPVSRMLFYVGFSIILLVLSFGIIPLCVEFGLTSSSFADNLKAECWGIFFTVIVIMLVLDLREYFQWRPIKDKVMETIGTELYEIFRDFAGLCKCPHYSWIDIEESGEEYAERIFFTQLEQLKEKVELEEQGKKVFSNGYLATLLERVASHLSEVEAKYSRFLDAELRLSLMEIQDTLNRFSIDLILRKKEPSWYENDELFFLIVSNNIQTIVEEIYKIHKMGIEIFRPYPIKKIEYRL